MNKKLLIKLFCLAVACLLLLPLVMACGDDENNNQNGESEEETVIVTFIPRGGDIISGKEEVEITKGEKLRESKCPEVEKTGYTFLYWAYDKLGTQEWDPGDPFREDTDLYAIWEEKTAGSNNGGNDNPDDGNGDGNTDGDNDTPVVEKVTIKFNTGVGYFEDNKYTYEIEKDGYFNGALPTPVCDNLAMKFEGWFKDAAFTVVASRSDSYSANTELYAYWIQMTPCIDGSYDHIWTAWDEDYKAPTCTAPGLKAQYCQTCSTSNTMTGKPATGHDWPSWQEGFLQRERTCRTLGCGAVQEQKFDNITLSTLGNTPENQMKLEMSAGWGSNRVGALINGNWDEPNTATFCGNSCEVKVTINLLNIAKMDRIYVKGHYAGASFNIFVQYEGDSDYTLVGTGSFLSKDQDADKENRVIPYANVDNTRNVVSVQIIMPNAGYGEDYWDEVAFISIPAIEEE